MAIVTEETQQLALSQLSCIQLTCCNISYRSLCQRGQVFKQVEWLQFKDGSFHVACDKGALDALMGEDTESADAAGSKLLSEVQRVLDATNGQYLCVTLGQPHVLSM